MAYSTRRQFLRQLSAGAALSVSIPALVSGPALGLDGNVPANSRITMGVIGCGSHSRTWNVPLMLANREQQIIALCDPDSQHLEAVRNQVDSAYAKQTGKESRTATYRDFRDLVNRKDIDAVDIITPDHWHVTLAVFAMKAGKHVICEKPVLTIKEGLRLVQTQKETGRIFHTASETRTIDTSQQIVNIVRNQIIGELKNIKVLIPFGNRKRGNMDFRVQPVPEHLDYELWTGPAPLLPYMPGRNHINWRNHLAYSGGTYPDWSAHYVNLAYWGNGSDETSPIRFTPNRKDPKTSWEFPKEDAPWTTTAGFDVTAEFANGVTMNVWSDNPAVKFEGTEGWVMVKGPGPYANVLTASSESIAKWTPGPNDIDVGRGMEHCTVSHTPGKGVQGIQGGEHVHFTHCIKAGTTETYYPARHAFNTDITGLAGNIAMYHGGLTLQWDPEAKKFVGENAEIANSSIFFDRPQRDPWTFEKIDSWINVG